MSRLGKKPITLPENTTVSIDGDVVSIKGPKGELSRSFRTEVVSIKEDEGKLVLEANDGEVFPRSLWGTYASHLSNMIIGVNEGYEKKLEIHGIGYKAELKGDTLVLHVGFSHPVEMDIPEGLEVNIEKNVLTVTGIDKEAIGQFCASVRDVKPPEPYKGKGIRYQDEFILRKEGKKAV